VVVVWLSWKCYEMLWVTQWVVTVVSLVGNMSEMKSFSFQSFLSTPLTLLHTLSWGLSLSLSSLDGP